MEQQVQCPVCTLYLHNGMSLESHLDTHPKDQVIKALCSLANKSGSSYGSRTSTPLHSERSYRSRSRTPATEDRWTGSHRSNDNDRYWRRTPSRMSRSSQILPNSRTATPETRVGDVNFENNLASSIPYSGTPYSIKTDKTQQSFANNPTLSEFDQQYVYYQDAQEDREIKYSRSADYAPIDSNSSVFTHRNLPSASSSVKLQSTLVPAVPRKGSENLVKLLPKPNNILVKTNVGGVQYITPSVKPMHVMVPAAPTFVQKNVQNNMIVTSTIPGAQMVDNKVVAPPLSTNQFNQMTSSTFTPGTTVVQNSQIIYREMVHNIDGKRFISCVPSVLSHENVTNVAQGTSMYQNVMVLDQLGNASCMYTTPQPILPKQCTSVYSDGLSHIPSSTSMHVDKSIPNAHDTNKTLIIEVGPIVPTSSETAAASTSSVTTQADISLTKACKSTKRDKPNKSETPGSSKGLKILSNIKVEVPVQHSKNMVNMVMDLTGPNESEYVERPISPEKILPDLDDNNDNMDTNQLMSDDCTQPSIASSDSIVSHTFSVIKNVGNPPSYKDTKPGVTDNKIDNEFSDSCPVPDLICNEKPSISPCSELSENGDNSIDHTSITPKPNICQQTSVDSNYEIKPVLQKPYRHNTLRLNNIFVKKHKKVLQIKNAKPFPTTSTSSQIETEPRASSSSCRSPENYSMSKLNIEKSDIHEKLSTLKTITVEQITIENELHHDFDADTEEQSMDIEPVASSSSHAHDNFTTSVDIVQVKEEANTSTEEGFSNENSLSNRGSVTPIEGLRPINVITYGNMAPGDFDDESNHRELLELEAASKNKQFVSMMSENYFGDNLYADYFTPDRETLDSERVPGFSKDGPKDGMYIWGESSHKESEFVLPNFIHESYKIAESSGIHYTELGSRSGQLEGDRDSKVDVLSEGRSEGEPPLNICADERMPPRGELSGQESNGDMESPWSGIYPDVPAAEPYDLIARESWVSDGSEMDSNEKRDNLEEELYPKVRGSVCAQCGAKFATGKELRAHKASVHVLTDSTDKSYSRMITARAIKKEEKPDETALQAAASLMPLDSKEAIATTVLQVYDSMAEAKPKIERLIKQEHKPRRRRDFVCPTCKVDQLTEVAFHAHLKIHPLECLTCGKCFFRRANLQLHIKTHLGIKNFKCDVCEKRFITKQKLMEHHNIHTGRAPVKCTVCDDTFRRYSNMLQHRDRHHFQKKPKVRDFVCQCGAVFQSKAKLQWHRETHDPRPKACLYCSDKFVHAASLTRHVRRTHNVYYLSEKHKGKAENVPCPVCKQIYLRTNLRAHLATHTGARAHVCVVCNKAFTTKWNLKLHRWTHLGRSAKPYRCALCKGAFIRHTEYVAHMNAHRAVRPYTCNYCGCQFIRKYNCQRHVREHENDKKYVCKVPECGKSFHRSYYLSEHMKVHSGARPFSCNICGKTSSNKSNHNKHLKIHHAREPVATEA